MDNKDNTFKEIKRAIDTMARIDELKTALDRDMKHNEEVVEKHGLPGNMIRYIKECALMKILECMTNPYFWSDTPDQSVSLMLDALTHMYEG